MLQRSPNMEVTVSLAPNGEFLITIPSDVSERSQVVTLPVNEHGAKALKRILSARSAGQRRLGMDGEPTREQVKNWLALERQLISAEIAERKAAREAERIAKIDEKIAEFGINIEELDL